jgi:hypothetical protein
MLRWRKRLVVAGLVAGVCGGLTGTVGCLPRQPESDPRAQAEYDPEKELAATVGSKTVMGNTEPIVVSGVGLVLGLKGTGSSPPPDGWRETMEKQLKRLQRNPKEILDDPNKSTSLVLVSAVIPAGSRTGDKLDLTVVLPPGSKTTSLSHGELFPCDLHNYELAGNARQQLAASGVPTGKVPLASAGTLIIGSRLAVGEGPLVVGSMVPDAASEASAEPADTPTRRATDNPSARVAKVWGGTTNHLDRPYQFLLNGEGPQPKLAMLVASRLNTVFHGSGDKAGKVAEATVSGRPLVAVFVPPAYRLNHQRFILVARQVPLVAPAPTDPARRRLEQELLAPETAVVAAMKLEVLGTEGEAALRVGLESKDPQTPWVRFAAAESLCYLGKADPTAAQVLAECAEKHPALRTQALLALASQDDHHCLDQLVELMKKNGDAALRYGAFHALRLANEKHEAVRGREMARSYWLHQVAADSDSLVHLTTDRRNEIVLFGSVWPLTGGFAFPLGTDFTVTRKEGEESVVVSRLVTKDGEPTTVTGKYRADLAVVLKGLAEMGGGYAEAIEFVRRMHAAEQLACKLAVDATPAGLTVQQLAQIARRDPTAAEADKLVLAVTGQTPGDDLTQTGGFDIPSAADAVKKPAAPIVPLQLNRDPGSVFDLGKKK